MGIFMEMSHIMAGTVKLGPINRHHGTAEVGILVGDRMFRGKGVGKRAIELITDAAFREHNLRKVHAGVYAANAASIIAFTRAGWVIEGCIPNQFVLDGEPVGVVKMAKYNEWWRDGKNTN
jgi:RimJ/RimL family protein N-acetyltransferase